MVEATTNVRVSRIDTVSNTIVVTSNPEANVDFAYIAFDDDDDVLLEQEALLFVSMEALEKEWNSPDDALYDDL